MLPYQKRIRKSLGPPPYEFGPINFPAIITVNGKKDFAERVIATGWTERALVTVLHGHVTVYRQTGVDPVEARQHEKEILAVESFERDSAIGVDLPTITELNTYGCRSDIQLVKELNPDEVESAKFQFTRLLNFK